MRIVLAFAIFLVASAMYSASFAEEQFPYSATILRDDSPVRSGPAAVHYATCRLNKGDTIQVFRKDPGGWLAIRPSEQDFSLVRAKFVLANFSKGTGKITGPDVQSWVGTLSPDEIEPMWQIRFKQGDLVRLIGKQQIEDTGGQLHSWYEIAPPSGEFRWIHESAIQPPVETKLAESRQAGNPAAGSSAAANSHDEGPDIPEAHITDVAIADTIAATAHATPSKKDATATDNLWRALESTSDKAHSAKSGAEAVDLIVGSTPVQPKPFEPEKFELAPGGSIFEHDIHRSGGTSNKNIAAYSSASHSQHARQHENTSAKNDQYQQAGWQVASETEQPRSSSSDGGSSASMQPPASRLDPLSLREPKRLGAIQSETAGGFHEPEDERRLGDAPQRGPQTAIMEQQVNIFDGSFDDRLRQVELGLTREVVKTTDQWQLAPYRSAVLELSRNAADARQQRQINALLEKIKSFDDLQQRHLLLNRSPSGEDSASQRASQTATATQSRQVQGVKPAGMVEFTSNNLLQQSDTESKRSDERDPGMLSKIVGAVTSSSKDSTDSDESEGTQYDATGWLSRLYTNNGRGQHGYVVQDASGNILSTILPAPGVNLDRYVDHEVGVIGRRGFNSKYNKPHVTADRVILLDRHR